MKNGKAKEEFKIYALGKSPMDGSAQYELRHIEGGKVIFSISGDKLYAHTWLCPKKGKIFLSELEKIARNWKKRTLCVPCVINMRLVKILMQHGYSVKIEKSPLFGPIEVWFKHLKGGV